MIIDNKAQSRFELPLNGELAYADYQRLPDRLIISHVFTPPALRGGGVASQLMQAIVQQAQQERLRIQPICSYAAIWMKRHPEHEALLAAS